MRSPEITRKVGRPDGCTVAYRVFNPSAQKTIILSNGLGCSDLFWKHIIDDLSVDHRVVTWDYRGLGDSTEPTSSDEAYVPAAHAWDLARIQQDLGALKAVHVGFGIGASIALEYHRRSADAVTSIVFIQGGMSPRQGNLSFGLSVQRSLLQLMSRGVNLAGSVVTSKYAPKKALDDTFLFSRRVALIGRLLNKSEFEQHMKFFSKQSLGTLIEIERGMANHPSDELLSRVTIPTLVFGASRDPIYPESLMRQVHAFLPKSEYSRLPGAGHTCLLELGPVISARMRRFLHEKLNGKQW